MKMKAKLEVLAPLALLVVGFVLMSGCMQESGEKPAGGGKTVTTSAGGGGGQPTAREAFRIAQTAAEDWASDAVLVEITNFRGSSEPDGHAARWVVKFGSAKMQKELDVHVVSGGKILQKLEGKYTRQDAVTGEWIDSTEAVDDARDHFSGKPVKNYWLGLSSNRDIVSWRVKCDHREGKPIWVEVNALTGDFIKTREGY